MSEVQNLDEIKPDGQETIVDEPVNEPAIITHPWYRYFARAIDMTIIGIIATIACTPLFILMELMNYYSLAIIIAIFSMLLSIFIEAGLLTLFGTTPGKLAFGIRVVTSENKNLTYLQSLKRCVGVWIRGLGLSIPLISFFTQLASYEKLTQEGITAWDQKGGFIVQHKEISKLRAALFIILYIASSIGLKLLEY